MYIVVFFYPGIQFNNVSYKFITESDLKVVILFSYGSGNLPN